MAAEDCVYCLGSRGVEVLTLEHVWPGALGGRAAPAAFKSSNVCQACNSLAGLFVDAPFLKNWFVQNEGLSGQQFLDPAEPRPTALFYLGFEDAFPTGEAEVCERWIGPAGEHIYHIHSKDDARWETVAGGDIIKRKKSDGERAYIVLTSKEPYWVLTALRSFSEWFPYAARRCITEVIGDLPDLGVRWVDQQPITEIESFEIEHIKGRLDGSQVHARMPIQVDFSDRFLAKVALGLSETLLGRSAVLSPYGADLRRVLWSRTPAEREGLSLRGSGFWAEHAGTPLMAEYLGTPGAWTILLSAQRDTFSFTLVSPAGRLMTYGISDDASLWPDHIGPTYGQGVVHIAIPERQAWFGPIPLPDLLSHRLGHGSEPSLARIEALRAEASRLPPKR